MPLPGLPAWAWALAGVRCVAWAEAGDPVGSTLREAARRLRSDIAERHGGGGGALDGPSRWRGSGARRGGPRVGACVRAARRGGGAGARLTGLLSARAELISAALHPSVPYVRGLRGAAPWVDLVRLSLWGATRARGARLRWWGPQQPLCARPQHRPRVHGRVRARVRVRAAAGGGGACRPRRARRGAPSRRWCVFAPTQSFSRPRNRFRAHAIVFAPTQLLSRPRNCSHAHATVFAPTQCFSHPRNCFRAHAIVFAPTQL